MTSQDTACGLVGHVALLRGVNVGARNRIAMSALLALAQDLGLASARTHLQSGNLIFAAPPEEGEAIGARLAAAIEARLQVKTPVIVRPVADLARALAANPFPEAARDDPSHLLVVFLAGPADADGLEALRAIARPEERLALLGRELFVHYAAGVADSRLTAATLDRRLRTVCTARNWTTCQALHRLAAAV